MCNFCIRRHHRSDRNRKSRPWSLINFEPQLQPVSPRRPVAKCYALATTHGSGHMQRRDFIILLGSAAWPLIARAQQTERMRRVGVLTGIEDDPEYQARNAAFLQGEPGGMGWTDGRNVRDRLSLGRGRG